MSIPIGIKKEQRIAALFLCRQLLLASDDTHSFRVAYFEGFFGTGDGFDFTHRLDLVFARDVEMRMDNVGDRKLLHSISSISLALRPVNLITGRIIGNQPSTKIDLETDFGLQKGKLSLRLLRLQIWPDYSFKITDSWRFSILSGICDPKPRSSAMSISSFFERALNFSRSRMT